MDKASSLFQHQAQKAAPPLLYPLSFRTRARITRAHYTIIPRFFAFTAFTTHRKTSRNGLICLYDLAFHLYIFTICLHLCLHPYSSDFQLLSPIGEGVKAICTHYIVYTRVRARERMRIKRKERWTKRKEERDKRIAYPHFQRKCRLIEAFRWPKFPFLSPKPHKRHAFGRYYRKTQKEKRFYLKKFCTFANNIERRAICCGRNFIV